MRILTVTSSFPNPQEPGNGPFVRARVRKMAELAEVRVIAPVPRIDYSNPQRRLFQSFSIPATRSDGPIQVRHPKWLFPPGGSPINVLCLFMRLIGTVIRLRLQFRYDVIDAHFTYPDGAAAALLAACTRTPLIITMRGNELVYRHQRLRRRCMQWALRRAVRVVTVSSELRELAVTLGVDPARAKTIPNGVDSEVFRTRDRDDCRRSHGIDLHVPVVLTAGGLGPAKGHDLVVEAVAQLRDRWPDIQLLIAGSVNRDGRFEAQIRDLIRARALEKNVTLLGAVSGERLSELMNAADVFCLASLSEGWPNVVHEALASGTPVVASRVGGVPDLVPREEFGYVVPVNDVPALVVALGRALSKSWDRGAISAWGQRRGWDQVAAEVIDVINQALPNSSPTARTSSAA